ncbi:MAG: M24 family metallopeptidase [Planctomycetota bacterium]|jgi:Xaa-Pro aminopeptidase|nr:M24 family metallopeptidase [Planctomycetota bacterium]
MKKYTDDPGIEARAAEIDVKAGRLRKVMEDRGLSAIAINKSNNFSWITAGADNIVTRYSEGGVATAVIAADGKRYVLLNSIEERRFREEERIDALGFEIVCWPWFEDKLLPALKKVAGGDIASDNGVPGTQDANSLVNPCQYSLLDREIARYLHLGATFSKALEEMLATVRPGDMELDIAGRIAAALRKHEVEPVLFLVAGDERILRYRHCVPTRNTIKKRLMISVNGRYKGLVTKTTRFVNFGEPDDEFIKRYNDTIDIENRLVAATTVGTDDIEILRLAKKLYAEKGCPEMWREHHQGGPQGYTNGYYLITDDRHGIVRKNQCYCYNPSITGAKTEDAFIVTEDGPAFVTAPVSFPKIKAVINGVEVERPGVLVM